MRCSYILFNKEKKKHLSGYSTLYRISEKYLSGVIEAFNSTSRYLDDLLNIDNNFFDSMVNRIYPSELQLNKANVSDAEASFLDLHIYIYLYQMVL